MWQSTDISTFVFGLIFTFHGTRKPKNVSGLAVRLPLFSLFVLKQILRQEFLNFVQFTHSILIYKCQNGDHLKQFLLVHISFVIQRVTVTQVKKLQKHNWYQHEA